MPLLALIGILLIRGLIGAAESCAPKGRVLTPEEWEQMSRETIGKSQKEVRRIHRKYFYGF